MGARRGNALSRSGRFTRIGRGSNSSPKPGPSSPPRAVRGGGGIDYGYGEADTPRIRIPTVPPRRGQRGPITTLPVPPRGGRRGPEINLDSFYRLNPHASRSENPVSSRPDQGPGTAPKEKREAQTKLSQIEDTQSARNRAVAARLDAAQQRLAQQQLSNTGGRVGETGVMGRPDSEMNADRGFRNVRVPSQSIDAQIQLLKNEDAMYAKNKAAAAQSKATVPSAMDAQIQSLQNEDAQYAQNKAKEMNRGIATRTVSFGRR